jgi:hypothetical protein
MPRAVASRRTVIEELAVAAKRDARLRAEGARIERR